jgi:hypothetical protein
VIKSGGRGGVEGTGPPRWYSPGEGGVSLRVRQTNWCKGIPHSLTYPTKGGGGELGTMCVRI